MQTELSFAYCYIAKHVSDFVLANHKWGSDSAKSPLCTLVQPSYDMSGENQTKKGGNYSSKSWFLLDVRSRCGCTAQMLVENETKKSKSRNRANECFGWHPRDRSKTFWIWKSKRFNKPTAEIFTVRSSEGAPRNCSEMWGECKSSSRTQKNRTLDREVRHDRNRRPQTLENQDDLPRIGLAVEFDAQKRIRSLPAWKSSNKMEKKTL